MRIGRIISSEVAIFNTALQKRSFRQGDRRAKVNEINSQKEESQKKARGKWSGSRGQPGSKRDCQRTESKDQGHHEICLSDTETLQ